MTQAGKSNNLKDLLKALSEASEEIAKTFGDELVGVALFGSWARGEGSEGSDVDVFVVLRTAKGLAVRSKIYRIIARHVRRAVTLIDMRLAELLNEELELTALLINIIADAVIIYDRDDFLKSFIEKGRRLIKKAGLVRYRTPDGKYGWMRRGGKPISVVEL